MSSHIPFVQLVELVEGQLSPAAQTLAHEHLATCRACAEEQAALRRVIDIMRRDTSRAMPAEVIARAVQLFRVARPAVQFSLPRILATLKFDSAQARPALSMRSGQWRTRHMLFNAGAYDLDLRLSPSDDGWRIKGQVLGPCEGGQVALSGETEVMDIRLDERCTFSFPAVSEGSYALILRLVDIEIVLPPVRLGA